MTFLGREKKKIIWDLCPWKDSGIWNVCFFTQKWNVRRKFGKPLSMEYIEGERIKTRTSPRDSVNICHSLIYCHYITYVVTNYIRFHQKSVKKSLGSLQMWKQLQHIHTLHSYRLTVQKEGYHNSRFKQASDIWMQRRNIQNLDKIIRKYRRADEVNTLQKLCRSISSMSCRIYKYAIESLLIDIV